MEIFDNRSETVITDSTIVKLVRGGSQLEIKLETGYSITISECELVEIAGEVRKD